MVCSSRFSTLLTSPPLNKKGPQSLIIPHGSHFSSLYSVQNLNILFYLHYAPSQTGRVQNLHFGYYHLPVWPPITLTKTESKYICKKNHFQKKAILDILPNFKDKNQQTNALILRSLKHLPSSERFKVEKKPARIVFFDFEFKSLKRVPKSRWFSKVRRVRTIKTLFQPIEKIQHFFQILCKP